MRYTLILYVAVLKAKMPQSAQLRRRSPALTPYTCEEQVSLCLRRCYHVFALLRQRARNTSSACDANIHRILYSFTWKGSIFKQCNRFGHMIHPRRDSDSLGNWTGHRWKPAMYFRSWESFRLWLLFYWDRELVCVVRRVEKCGQEKKERTRSTTGEGLQFITRLIEKENKTAWMFIAVSQGAEFQRVFFRVAGPPDYYPGRWRVSSHPTHTNTCHVKRTHAA